MVFADGNEWRSGFRVEAVGSYRWIAAHRSTAFDEVRNPAYFKAIREHVNHTSTILDLGTGVGILGLEAVRRGALKVYLIDPEVVHLAHDVARANGISDRVEIMYSVFKKVRLAEPVDLILSAFTGSFLLDEDLLPFWFLARDRFLKPGGKLIPVGPGWRLDLDLVPDAGWNPAAALDFPECPAYTR